MLFLRGLIPEYTVPEYSERSSNSIYNYFSALFQLQGRDSFQLVSIQWRFVLRCGPVQMASMPNSVTAALRLCGMVLHALACASGQLPATDSMLRSMDLGPSVELLLVPSDVLRLTGATGTVVGVVRLALINWHYEHVTCRDYGARATTAGVAEPIDLATVTGTMELCSGAGVPNVPGLRHQQNYAVS